MKCLELKLRNRLKTPSTFTIENKIHVQMLPPKENHMSFNTTPTSSDSSSSSDDSPIRRRSIPPDADNLMVAALGANENNAVPQEPVESLNIDHFCRFVGSRLRALDPQSRLQLQIKIIQLIFEAEAREV